MPILSNDMGGNLVDLVEGNQKILREINALFNPSMYLNLCGIDNKGMVKNYLKKYALEKEFIKKNKFFINFSHLPFTEEDNFSSFVMTDNDLGRNFYNKKKEGGEESKGRETINSRGINEDKSTSEQTLQTFLSFFSSNRSTPSLSVVQQEHNDNFTHSNLVKCFNGVLKKMKYYYESKDNNFLNCISTSDDKIDWLFFHFKFSLCFLCLYGDNMVCDEICKSEEVNVDVQIFLYYLEHFLDICSNQIFLGEEFNNSLIHFFSLKFNQVVSCLANVRKKVKGWRLEEKRKVMLVIDRFTRKIYGLGFYVNKKNNYLFIDSSQNGSEDNGAKCFVENSEKSYFNNFIGEINKVLSSKYMYQKLASFLVSSFIDSICVNAIHLSSRCLEEKVIEVLRENYLVGVLKRKVIDFFVSILTAYELEDGQLDVPKLVCSSLVDFCNQEYSFMSGALCVALGKSCFVNAVKSDDLYRECLDKFSNLYKVIIVDSGNLPHEYYERDKNMGRCSRSDYRRKDVDVLCNVAEKQYGVGPHDIAIEKPWYLRYLSWIFPGKMQEHDMILSRVDNYDYLDQYLDDKMSSHLLRLILVSSNIMKGTTKRVKWRNELNASRQSLSQWWSRWSYDRLKEKEEEVSESITTLSQKFYDRALFVLSKGNNIDRESVVSNDSMKHLVGLSCSDLSLILDQESKIYHLFDKNELASIISIEKRKLFYKKYICSLLTSLLAELKYNVTQFGSYNKADWRSPGHEITNLLNAFERLVDLPNGLIDQEQKKQIKTFTCFLTSVSNKDIVAFKGAVDFLMRSVIPEDKRIYSSCIIDYLIKKQFSTIDPGHIDCLAEGQDSFDDPESYDQKINFFKMLKTHFPQKSRSLDAGILRLQKIKDLAVERLLKKFLVYNHFGGQCGEFRITSANNVGDYCENHRDNKVDRDSSLPLSVSAPITPVQIVPLSAPLSTRFSPVSVMALLPSYSVLRPPSNEILKSLGVINHLNILLETEISSNQMYDAYSIKDNNDDFILIPSLIFFTKRMLPFLNGVPYQLNALSQQELDYYKCSVFFQEALHKGMFSSVGKGNNLKMPILDSIQSEVLPYLKKSDRFVDINDCFNKTISCLQSVHPAVALRFNSLFLPVTNDDRVSQKYTVKKIKSDIYFVNLVFQLANEKNKNFLLQSIKTRWSQFFKWVESNLSLEWLIFLLSDGGPHGFVFEYLLSQTPLFFLDDHIMLAFLEQNSVKAIRYIWSKESELNSSEISDQLKQFIVKKVNLYLSGDFIFSSVEQQKKMFDLYQTVKLGEDEVNLLWVDFFNFMILFHDSISEFDCEVYIIKYKLVIDKIYNIDGYLNLMSKFSNFMFDHIKDNDGSMKRRCILYFGNKWFNLFIKRVFSGSKCLFKKYGENIFSSGDFDADNLFRFSFFSIMLFSSIDESPWLSRMYLELIVGNSFLSEQSDRVQLKNVQRQYYRRLYSFTKCFSVSSDQKVSRCDLLRFFVKLCNDDDRVGVYSPLCFSTEYVRENMNLSIYDPFICFDDPMFFLAKCIFLGLSRGCVFDVKKSTSESFFNGVIFKLYYLLHYCVKKQEESTQLPKKNISDEYIKNVIRERFHFNSDVFVKNEFNRLFGRRLA